MIFNICQLIFEKWWQLEPPRSLRHHSNFYYWLKLSIKCSGSFLFMIKFTGFYWCICLFIASWLVKLQGTAHYWERAIEVCITRVAWGLVSANPRLNFTAGFFFLDTIVFRKSALLPLWSNSAKIVSLALHSWGCSSTALEKYFTLGGMSSSCRLRRLVSVWWGWCTKRCW